MSSISAALVKELRERTGAGMMECKSALVESNGNVAEAEVVLRKRGAASAAKKATRTTKQGLVEARVEGRTGVLVEVNCESDFVARTEDFGQLVEELSRHLLHSSSEEVRSSTGGPSLYGETIGTEGQTIEQYIQARIQKTGENIGVSRFARFTISEGQDAVLGTYLHPGSQLGVMVEVTGVSSGGSGDLESLVRDVAMQVAAADPQFISRQDVTPEALEKEREIYRARTLAEGKPEKVVDKIVEGRMNKYYEEVCLLEQPFIKDNSVTVGQLLQQKSGSSAKVTRMARFKVGDTIPDAPAAE